MRLWLKASICRDVAAGGSSVSLRDMSMVQTRVSIACIQHDAVVPLCDTRDLGEIFFDYLHPHARGRRMIGRREPYIDHQILELDAVIEASTTKE